MHILFISDYLPYPPISGGRIRLYNLMRQIARQHKVSLVGFLASPDQIDSLPHLRQFCQNVETAVLRRRHPLVRLPSLVKFALEGKPLEHNFLYSEELALKIRQLVVSEDFDIVQIETERMALYLDALPSDARYKSAVMLYDVAFQQYERISHFQRQLTRRVRSFLHSRALRRWEPRYLERFDRCITVSEADRRVLKSVNPRLNVELVPNGVDTRQYQPLPQDGNQPALLFIGNMSYAPCIDAALYLCREILPRIRQEISNVQVWIVGRDPSPEVLQLDGNGIHVTGRVDDVVPYYKRTTVCVVPLRAGGGTRLKILEAMALGRPVVSTTIGCEGLNVSNDKDLLVANSPEEFAQKTVRLLTDPLLRECITDRARQLVVTQYDWDALAGCLMQIYAEMIR